MWGCHMPKTHAASILSMPDTNLPLYVSGLHSEASNVNMTDMVCAMHFIILISCWISADNQETLPYSKCPDVCTIFNLVFITSSFETWLWKVKVAQSCPTLCNPMDYTDLGILQARILEWVVAFPFSRGSSQPRDRTQVSRIAGGFFTSWATKEGSGNCPYFKYCFVPVVDFLLYPR